MPGISLVLMTVAGLLHVGFFVIESLIWERPRIHRLFGVRNPEEAQIMRFALFNQGFYNLFLACGALVGVAISSDVVFVANDSLLIFCALFMIGAAVVLMVSNRQLWRGGAGAGGRAAIGVGSGGRSLSAYSTSPRARPLPPSTGKRIRISQPF